MHTHTASSITNIYQTVLEEVSEIRNLSKDINLVMEVPGYFISSLIESKSETFAFRYWLSMKRKL